MGVIWYSIKINLCLLSENPVTAQIKKKVIFTPRHVSGRLSSFCWIVYWQAKLTCTNNIDTHQSVRGLAGVGTRLYDSLTPTWVNGSPARAELNSMDTVYEQLSLIVVLRHRQRFRAQLTGERDRPLCSNETSNLRQNWTLCDHRTSPLCMHMASRTRIVATVPNYGEHVWDYVIISWRHNLGATFLYFMFAIKEISNVSWTLKIVSFPKFWMQFDYG